MSVTGSLLEAQHRVLESIVRGRPLSEVLNALCLIVEKHAGARVRAAVLLKEERGPRLFTGAAPSLPESYSRAIDGIAIAPDVGTCCAAAARCAVVITPDIATDPAWVDLRHLPLGLGLKAAWSMPILSSMGEALGTFGTYFLETREPTREERQLVKVLAQTASLAIERARADRALQSGARRDRFLAELAAATRPLASPEALMETSARLLVEHLGASRCAYAEVKDDAFMITGDYAPTLPSSVGRWPIAAFGAACSRAMHHGQAFVVSDTECDPQIGPADLPAYRATDIRALIWVPLHKHGRLTAAMAVHQSEPRSWSSEEVELVRLVVAGCWEALERTRVERTLQQSELRYRAMVEASPDCVMLIAADGTLLQINDIGLSMIEVDDETSALGRSSFDWVAPAQRSAFEQFHRRVCAGEHGTLAFELIGRRGGRRWMEASAVPLALGNQVDRAHLAIARDVTSRVEAETALAQSRARLDYAVELSGVGFWYCDLPFDELIWDGRVRAHFFLPSDARVTLDTFYAMLHPDDREGTRQAVERSIATRTPYDVVYRTLCPTTGDTKWIRAIGGTAYDDAGQPRRFDGVTLDVTAQRRAQEKLAELLEREQDEGRERARLVSQLREQERRKDEFLATLAHELRNPLAALRFGLELIERGGEREVTDKARAAMGRQLTHLVHMVDDLLDTSRVTLGKLTLKSELVDFRDVLQSALETTSPAIEADRQDLRVILPAVALPVLCDTTRLSQVLANLLNNASKYTPQGGRIELEVSVQQEQLQVTISDNGIGIPPEMNEKIFDVFMQIERSMKQARGGLGLGLTLVRRLVELHGGTVRASSVGVGQGSTFTLRLPLANAAPAGAKASEPASVAVTASTLRVLVVDDNEDAAECLASLLQQQGHAVALAHSGPEALESVGVHAPDVVLLDIGLPGCDGYEVARQLRARLGQERMPRLIAVTGFGTRDDQRRTSEAGFEAHLVKPISTSLLTRALHVAAK